MIKTAPIKDCKDLMQCLRISTMSRHTLSDGVTPDPEITKDLFDIHLVGLAPPPKLVGAYYRGEVSWEEFERRYIDHIRQDSVLEIINNCIAVSDYCDVIFMCIEDTPDQCHRRLLAEECLRIDPHLEVEIK